MKRQIVLIACASQKLEHKAFVRNLYISTLFRYNLRYAKQLQPDDIAVLSAKHGLLTLEEEIEPYNLTLNTMKVSEIKRWANIVKGQMEVVCPSDQCEYTYLAGEKYRKYLVTYTKDYSVPLKGLGIGQQLKMLKELTA